MRALGVLACTFLFLLPQSAASSDHSTSQDVLSSLGIPAQPPMAPSKDETPVDSSGNWETDALLDCYAKFQGPDMKGGPLGPPHITQSQKFGYLLRADFARKDGNASMVDRLVCSKAGFQTQKDLSVFTLDAAGSSSPDISNQRLIDGWIARRNAAAIARATARRFAPPDADTVRLLEGIWLVGKKPDKGTCASHWYMETQIEFEFRKTRGRALIFNPYDQFTAISISGIEKSGDVLSIQGQARDGGLAPFMNVRALGPDRIELTHPSNDGPAHPSEIAYRCGDPDFSVNGSVSPKGLASISQVLSGGWSSPVAVPGASDSDICQGRVREPADAKGWTKHRSIQFELYGPVHFWIMAWDFWPEHKIAFDFIRSIRQIDEHTFKLAMQEHLEKGDGWDVPESRGKTYELTIMDKGTRFEIPELSATFVRCKPEDSASFGMEPM